MPCDPLIRAWVCNAVNVQCLCFLIKGSQFESCRARHHILYVEWKFLRILEISKVDGPAEVTISAGNPIQARERKMALPKSYLTSAKNLAAILDAIKGAQAPPKFTIRFLESLEFKSNPDRLVLGVLKSIGFLGEDGKPTERYFKFLDQTQSEIVLADGIRDAYADLFQVNKTANKLSKSEVVGKFKTLSQGQYSDSVLDKMAMTFVELCKLGDFETKPAIEQESREDGEAESKEESASESSRELRLGGLHYNIQIILPESRDPKVYDALFRSLKEHLL